MQKAVLLILFSFLLSKASALHITGGEMGYQYIGPGDAEGTNKYRITMILFRGDDGTDSVFAGNYIIGVYSNGNWGKVWGNAPPYKNWFIYAEGPPQGLPVIYSSCIGGAPSLGYSYCRYSCIIDLKDNPDGYTIVHQTYPRPSGAINAETRKVGATFTCAIPGTKLFGPGFHDNSPQFKLAIPVICADSKFSFDCSAVDKDDDSLVYVFSQALDGGGANKHIYRDPGGPPFKSIEYFSPYTGFTPMGPDVTLDSRTGVISGMSGEEGYYILCISAHSYRRNSSGVYTYVSTQKKDIVIRVFSCQTPTAKIGPLPDALCDSFNVAFTNAGYNPPYTKYRWNFGDPASGPGNTSTLENPQHLYSVAGDYTVQLITDLNEGECSDTATKLVKLYPGFYPAFNIKGKCAFIDIEFTDKTVADYGSVNSWQWNFGDFADRVNNTSVLQNPTHNYPHPGGFPIHLTVTSSNGCVASKDTLIRLLDKPAFAVTNDTLICSIDTLQLNSEGDGSVTWTPNYMISSLTSRSPLVSPDVSTTYYARLTSPDGCIGYDSVKVSVVDFVTLHARTDTTICQADPVVLHISSDALYYKWTAVPPDPSLTDAAAKNPVVKAQANTVYTVRASISNKCYADDNITITAIPYPRPDAGPDIPVCFGNSTQLHAGGGAYYAWTPALFLSDTHIPDPKVLTPTSGVTYVVAVRDTLGCPKTVRDTVLVKVISLKADAGPADTSVVLHQPLQLHATGGMHYSWLPVTGLSDPLSPNPVALPRDNIRYTVTVTDENGCRGIDDIYVKLYKVDPGLYMPNAFTPNGDGINDNFQPIGLGLASLDFFRIYNRLGQLIFSTSSMKQGWDGTYKGTPQDQGTYVWIATGTDYTGRKAERKGTVILIRQ